jgi:hypothetical protein
MAVTRSAFARWTVPLVGAVLLAACTGSTSASTADTASATGTTSAATTTTAAAPATTTASLSAQDTAWVQGIESLGNRLNKAVTDVGSNPSEKTLRALADQLRTCTPDLAKLGAPTERLQPVSDLAKQGCAKYDEAATCYAKAASLRVGGSLTDLRKQLSCATSAALQAGKLLADADVKGLQALAAGS